MYKLEVKCVPFRNGEEHTSGDRAVKKVEDIMFSHKSGDQCFFSVRWVKTTKEKNYYPNTK